MVTVNRKPPALKARAARIDACLGTIPTSPAPATPRRQLPPSDLPTIAVYDGRLLVGEVVVTADGRYVAHDAAGHVIGSYPSARAATDALLAARRGARR
jgi:hypothetical protein